MNTAPNYRAFCIAVLELRSEAAPEVITALAKRYALLIECPDTGKWVENPML